MIIYPLKIKNIDVKFEAASEAEAQEKANRYCGIIVG